MPGPPSITVEPAGVPAEGEHRFSVHGDGWVGTAPNFILACPMPASGRVEDLRADLCDASKLTPAQQIEGSFDVEAVFYVPAEGLVIAAGDAAQTQAVGWPVRVG